jgi:uncharacterized protein YuzE
LKIEYDCEADALYIRLSELPVAESDEHKPGLSIDYADDGSVIGIEILDASRRMPQPTRFEYEVA